MFVEFSLGVHPKFDFESISSQYQNCNFRSAKNGAVLVIGEETERSALQAQFFIPRTVSDAIEVRQAIRLRVLTNFGKCPKCKTTRAGKTACSCGYHWAESLDVDRAYTVLIRNGDAGIGIRRTWCPPGRTGCHSVRSGSPQYIAPSEDQERI